MQAFSPALRWLAVWLLAGLTALGYADEARPSAADPVLEARMMAIAAELRCVVCQNQTIADSHAGLASDLRQQIRDQLRAGRSEAEIRAFMTARYGDFVLYRPPMNERTALLWAGPGLLLAIGLGALAVALHRRNRLPADAFESAPPLTSRPPPMTESIDELKAQLRHIDDWAGSVLSDTAAGSAREALEKRLLAAVMAAPPAQPAAAPAAPAATPERPIPRRLAWGMAVFVLVFGAAGYALLGNREAWHTVPATASADTAASPTAAASAPHAMTTAQIEGMVDGLAARLKNEPDNAEGWLMLGRSYSVLGQFGPAIKAYRHVLTLQPKNAQALADLADALAMTHGRSFDGEPAKLVQQALAADGTNLKALLLAGTIAFDKKDYATAARHWDLAQKAGPPDSDLVKQARENAAEARQLAGLPTAAPEPAAPVAATTGPAVSGRVELAPALAARAAPEDTVFVFARPSEGSRMPLAILKKRVRDLPLAFTLDDSLAMSPQARLSQASRVVVGARVSKSGQAMPQPGDLEGLSAPVAPGASDLKLVIAEVVR